MTLDEANAMLAEFDTDKEVAMDTNTDGDEGIQVNIICETLSIFFLADEDGRKGLGLGRRWSMIVISFYTGSQ